MRSGSTSVEGDVAARPRALRAALLAARGRGLPPRPPHPVVLHIGGERKGRSGEWGRRRRRRRRGSSQMLSFTMPSLLELASKGPACLSPPPRTCPLPCWCGVLKVQEPQSNLFLFVRCFLVQRAATPEAGGPGMGWHTYQKGDGARGGRDAAFGVPATCSLRARGRWRILSNRSCRAHRAAQVPPGAPQ